MKEIGIGTELCLRELPNIAREGNFRESLRLMGVKNEDLFVIEDVVKIHDEIKDLVFKQPGIKVEIEEFLVKLRAKSFPFLVEIGKRALEKSIAAYEFEEEIKKLISKER